MTSNLRVRKWRASHLEKSREISRRWKLANRERVKQYRREYYWTYEKARAT
jgi:hypothetical protein